MGGAAQTKIIKKLSGGIRTALAQYRELAAFAQFASDLDDATKQQLEHGVRVTELMKQKQYAPMSIADQAAVIYASNEGYLSDVPVRKIGAFEEAFLRYLRNDHAALMSEIDETANYNDDIESRLKLQLSHLKHQQATDCSKEIWCVKRWF